MFSIMGGCQLLGTDRGDMLAQVWLVDPEGQGASPPTFPQGFRVALGQRQGLFYPLDR